MDAKLAKCPFCFSTDVHIVHSEDTKDVMVIRCDVCERQSPIDVENPMVRDANPAPPQPQDQQPVARGRC